MTEVTYTLLAGGKEHGTITRSEYFKGKSFDYVVDTMLSELIKANKLASELFYDNHTGNWFDSNERQEVFIELLETLNKAILATKD